MQLHEGNGLITRIAKKSTAIDEIFLRMYI